MLEKVGSDPETSAEVVLKAKLKENWGCEKGYDRPRSNLILGYPHAPLHYVPPDNALAHSN